MSEYVYRDHSCADCAWYSPEHCGYWKNYAVEWDLCGKWERTMNDGTSEEQQADRAESRGDTDESRESEGVAPPEHSKAEDGV